MSTVLATAGSLTVRQLGSGLIALEFSSPPQPYITLTPDRWNDLVRAAKKAGEYDRQVPVHK